MILIFGLDFDEVPLSALQKKSGVLYLGKKNLMHYLELLLGLAGSHDDHEYLRAEQYRQGIIRYMKDIPDESSRAFFVKSFETDPFSTAKDLLSRRDELHLAGWEFEIQPNTPSRLRTIAGIEKVMTQGHNPIILHKGLPERFNAIIKMLSKRQIQFEKIFVNEPFELLPDIFRRILSILAKDHLPEQLFPEGFAAADATSDLQKFQLRLLQKQKPAFFRKHLPLKDGSLIIIRAKRESDAASFVSQMCYLNTHFKPFCIVPDKSTSLALSMIQEGIPSPGVESESPARPALQLLKLATTFLWQPVDPFRILEFLSLPLKPLPDDLSALIANHVSQTPGILSEHWYAMIAGYFQDMAHSNETRPESLKTDIQAIRKQYSFWFERKRYDQDKKAPKSAAIEIYRYLQIWSRKTYDELNGRNSTLLVMSEQAKRISETLETVPEPELGSLEIERIVRAHTKTSPIVIRECEEGHLPVVNFPSAIASATDEILWWNFNEKEPFHFFPRWYDSERKYLNELRLELASPEKENALMQWQSKRPLLLATKRLILVIPEFINGESVAPHSLFADIQACFENSKCLVLDIDSQSGYEILGGQLHVPHKQPLSVKPLGKPKPFLEMRQNQNLIREKETFTSLETLFYFPYQWVFKYRLKLNKSPILSVVNDNALMGNLAHRIFEKLLQLDIASLTRNSLEQWIEKESRKLFKGEGSVLLMYGREPQGVAFINTMKYAAWSLLCHIRDNGWTVMGTEQKLLGDFPGQGYTDIPSTALHGIADLVLQRNHEYAVIDIKWRGTKFREQSLRNEEDLQLVLYSRLLSPEGDWPHSCFFIVSRGKMISRNNLAFKKVVPVVNSEDNKPIFERIYTRMAKTWHWRLRQLSNGFIEVRTPQTEKEIEAYYESAESPGFMFELLEMAGKESVFDDYKTLIHAVE